MKAKWAVSRSTVALAILGFAALLFLAEIAVGRAVEAVSGRPLSSYLGRGPRKPDLVGFAILGFLANLTPGLLMADAAFKRLGLARGGRTVEGRRPAPDGAPSAWQDEGLEFRVPEAEWQIPNLFLFGCAGWCLLMFCFAEIFMPLRLPPHRQFAPAYRVLYVILLVPAVTLFLASHFGRHRVVIRVGSEGVTVPGKMREPVTWDRIAACELVEVRNPFGHVCQKFPVFWDDRGEDLFRGATRWVSCLKPQDWEQLRGSLERRFPKLDQDPLGL